MRRKRLQHVADTLCHMFCGWRLINSYPALERLGSGTLVIDVLTETCTHNGRPVGPLSIAAELHAWLRQDLTANRIEFDARREASVTAALAFGTVRSDQRLAQDVHVYPTAAGRASAVHRLRHRLPESCGHRRGGLHVGVHGSRGEQGWTALRRRRLP